MRFSAATVNPDLRIAYVSINEKLLSELNQMLNEELTPFDTEIFSTLSEAEVWAGR